MTKRTLPLDERLYNYLLSVSLREPGILAELRAETAQLPMAMMQIAADQGQFMALLLRLIGARRVLEIGTFTGYSSLTMALALPPDGRILCCDVSETYTAVARRYWEKAGVADKITLKLAPALETLDALLAEGQTGAFDFCFIDADKQNYDGYYERALRLVRVGGLIAIDNVLWGGAVADPDDQESDTQAIRALNKKLASDRRIDLSLLPVGDGLTLARKR